MFVKIDVLAALAAVAAMAAVAAVAAVATVAAVAARLPWPSVDVQDPTLSCRPGRSLESRPPRRRLHAVANRRPSP